MPNAGRSVRSPAFGMMQTQHLGFHRARDHRRRSTEAPAAPGSQSREPRQPHLTKIAVPGLAMSLMATLPGQCARDIGCRGCIGGLCRGHIDRDRHREHRPRRCTSLMRQFLLAPLVPGLLSGGVALGPTAGALVARTGTPTRLAPALHRALSATINVAPVAPAAQAHRYAAAPAAIQPVALCPHLHRTPPQDWTAPCIAGINTVAGDRPHRHRTAEGPGVVRRFPGLRCFGVA